MASFQPDDASLDLGAVQVPDGVIVNHAVRPLNRAFVTLAMRVPGIRDQWAARELVPALYNAHGLHNNTMLDHDIECDWSYSNGHVVSNLCCDRGKLTSAARMWAETLRNSTFERDQYEVQRGRLAAMTNGSVYDAHLRSQAAVYNRLYDTSDDNYILPVEGRKQSIRMLSNPQIVHQLIDDMQKVPVRVSTLNVSPELRASVVSAVAPAVSVVPPRQCYASTARKMTVGSERISVPNTPSLNVCIGQRFEGVSPDDTERILKLKLATLTMGNSFTGKLMKIVRDKEGLTYGISARRQQRSFPSMIVNATFNNNVLDRGHELTMNC